MSLIKDIENWIFPKGKCVICKRSLQKSEEEICTHCLAGLPYTQLGSNEQNKLEKYFWEQIAVERATALFVYYKDHAAHHILQYLKYKGHGKVGIVMGKIIAKQLLNTPFFDTIDVIVPVPLATDRLKTRGYNQAEMLAKGVNEITHIPVVTEGVRRTVSNVSQTQLNKAQRANNVKDIFKIDNPERFAGKHILLVDDVVTTGATLISLAKAFKGCEGIRFSVMALAMSAAITEVPYYPTDTYDESHNQQGVVYIAE